MPPIRKWDQQLRQCAQCGTDFLPRLQKSRFCKRDCYHAYRNRNLTFHKCLREGCNVVVEENRKYCSTACSNKANKTLPKVEKTCEICGTKFLVFPGRKDTARFCSPECNYVDNKERFSQVIANLYLSGEMHHRYGCFKSGWFTSSKTNLKMWYRSSYELRMMEFLESNPEVEYFKAEALAIPYVFENNQHHYIPDLYVRKANGDELLIEVKMLWQTTDPKTMQKFAAGRQYCQSRNWRYVILTEEEIDSDQRIVL